MSIVDTKSAETAYATKNNIVFPGSDAQRDAAEAKAASDLGDEFGPNFDIAVAEGAIVIDGEPNVPGTFE